MQSYRDGGNSHLTTSAAPIGGASDGISKYSTLYEQSMNPFEAFRGRVSQTNRVPVLPNQNDLGRKHKGRTAIFILRQFLQARHLL